LAWNINLGANKEIIGVKTQYDQQSTASHQKHYLPTDYGQTGELLYKYLDQNMFAVMMAQADDPTELTVMLINAVTGRIIHQFSESDVSNSKAHPVSTLFTENYFAISFMRLNLASGLTQQELTVVQLYQKKQENDTAKLLSEYFWGGESSLNAATYSSFALESQPEVLSETYILPFGVKAMAMTETLHYITGRSIMLVTSQNKIYQMQENFFSARRNHPEKPAALPTSFKEAWNDALEQARELEEEKERLVLKSDKFPMYDPVIPQVNQKFITYDLQLVNLDTLLTFPSKLESTTQVFAYGHDLFLARVKPDGKYDTLDEQFNYMMLLGICVVILGGNWYGSNLVKVETQRSQFLTL